MSSSSSSPSSTKGSTCKTVTTLASSSAQAAAAAQQVSNAPLIFPDPVNECLCSLLYQRDILTLSEVSKVVKDDYDDKLRIAVLRLQNDSPVTSFFAFVRRHKNLHILHIRSTDLLPCLLPCLGRGDFSLVKQLTFQDGISSYCVSTLAGLLADGALPVLEDFWILGAQEKGTTEAIMKAFHAGACPLLKGLALSIVCFEMFVDEDGTEVVVVDEEQTERDMEAIANALEARAAAGTCEGLQELRANWLEHGSVGVRTRLLRVLLPSIACLPDVEWSLDFAMTVKEVGAPGLIGLFLTPGIPPLVDAIASMNNLKRLDLSRSSLRGTSCYHFIALMQRYKHYFLPNLVDLVMQYPFDDDTDAKRFFETAGKNQVFASLTELTVDLSKPSLLALAFSGGAFAGLEQLLFIGGGGTDDDFANLCQSLEANPCAATLNFLSFHKCGIKRKGMNSLGTLFAHEALPCLKHLQLSDHEINDKGVLHLAAGIAAGRPLALTRLYIRFSEMRDAGLQALLYVIEGGSLPALEDLLLADNRISDTGVAAISKTAQGGHLRKLKKLDLGGNEMEPYGAALLATTIATHCPKLVSLVLSKLEKPYRRTIRAILKEKKEIVSFEKRILLCNVR